MAETETSFTAPDPAETSADQPGIIIYDGETVTLAKLGIKLSLLTIITAGIYRFWGKTNIRRYLWSRVSIVGNRLEYTGTGKELFLGFLIVLAVLFPYGVAVGLLQFAAGTNVALVAVIEMSQYLIILYLIGFARFRARLYRLSRTLLRGVRFGQSGSSGKFALKWMGYLILTFISLGIARPWGDVAIHRYLMTNSWFGGQRFDYEGKARDMLKTWIICLVLMLPTLGLSLVWYAAYKTRYLIGGTSFQNLKLSLLIEFKDLIKIYLTAIAAFLLVVIGVGVISALLFSLFVSAPDVIASATPLAFFLTVLVFGSAISLVFLTHPMLKLIADRFSADGEIDFEKILQSAQEKPGTGEGLADALDVGGGLEVGL